MRRTAYLRAFLAAALFGLSPALSKRVGLDRSPLVGSALLYGGAALALLATLAVQYIRDRVLQRTAPREAGLRREDLPTLAAVILVGGLAAPMLLLYGLARTTAGIASLLLNLETVFTAALAVAVFREHLSVRAGLALGVVLAGAVWLGWAPDALHPRSLRGVLAIAGACLGWATDTNLTQRLSARDPKIVVAAKGLGASVCAGLLAVVLGAHAPGIRVAAGGLVVGSLCYGVSLVLYVRAQRDLGAARTGAFLAVAPFVGAVAASVLLGERPGLSLAGAGTLMAVGMALFLRESHAHGHAHEALEHAHAHVHDEHHQHAHAPDDGPEPHAHLHRHVPLFHDHPHDSDVHHRHRH